MRISGTRLVALAVLVLALVALVGKAARAQGISRHSNLQVRPLVEKGQTVGFRLTGILHPQGFAAARLGIGRTSVREAIHAQGWDPAKMRRLLEAKDPSYIRMDLGEIGGLAQSGMREFEYKVRYGEGNHGLKPGEIVDVFSAWRNANDTAPRHFFGVFQSGDHISTTVKLP
jgi:hypothetical protein